MAGGGKVLLTLCCCHMPSRHPTAPFVNCEDSLQLTRVPGKTNSYEELIPTPCTLANYKRFLQLTKVQWGNLRSVKKGTLHFALPGPIIMAIPGPIIRPAGLPPDYRQRVLFA